ncbi:hypothetical protein F4680DRAFT_468438 [Xylaria scruposa]|nr:hypothetical protein F4680DRAFT_468438 [Xylaria scruposa]
MIANAKTLVPLVWGLLSLRAAAGVVNPLVLRNDDDFATSRACTRLSSRFPHSVSWPNSIEFQTQSTALYSDTCIFTPSCVFEPSSAAMIAEGVKIMKAERSKFAVRSGGHMPVPGAQSVQGGVMIAMDKLNQKSLNAAKTVASIGPGQVWADVYNWLVPYGLAVNGGRYPSVGVGGYMLGGGISYFSSTKGWGCDTVVAYEVVLADGQVVEARANGAYSDLFWALHGGHNNFGIVTRFDLQTFPMTSAYVGGAIWDGRDASANTQYFAALNSYLAPGGGAEDPNVAISAILALTPSEGVKELISIQLAPGTQEQPRAFENFTKIMAPAIQTVPGMVAPSWTSILPLLQQFGDRGFRQLFWSISFKGDPRAIRIANETLVDLADAALSGIPNATVAFTYQPVSKAWLQASKASGNNVLDLDPKDGAFVAGLLACTWQDKADDAAIHAFARNFSSAVENKTRALELFHPFAYLNDAAPEQKPFETYGQGKSLPRLRRIRDKYDPDNFLKNFMGHGFLLD